MVGSVLGSVFLVVLWVGCCDLLVVGVELVLLLAWLLVGALVPVLAGDFVVVRGLPVDLVLLGVLDRLCCWVICTCDGFRVRWLGVDLGFGDYLVVVC